MRVPPFTLRGFPARLTFPREADNAIFTYEQIKISNSVTLTVTVYHKKTSDIGEGEENSGVGSWASDGDLRYKEFQALEEMVRFQVSVSSEVASVTSEASFEYPAGAYPESELQEVNTSVAVTAIGFAIYRFLAPTWFDTGGPNWNAS